MLSIYRKNTTVLCNYYEWCLDQQMARFLSMVTKMF
jgi:hypothetical protein